ncbi:carbohydrate ABC transporter permease [Bifidobacterium pullorum subsp. saeculare]|uniref:Carbohydrate ABC transporter permease n=1 Tax=Bifidobacterium pullorum subsp. saeculare TaxID=78257 RepID=A0A938WYK6_9BIFI|nr:carbohydrate ABC transporter permease [Bifidobacterium pullorum subsp. saeculare]
MVLQVVKQLVVLAVALLMLYPILWMIASSLRKPSEIFTNMGLWVSDPQWHNYADGWNALSYSFGKYFLNSLIIVAFAIVGNIVTCSMATYAFARLNFRFRGLMFGFMLLMLMIPAQVTIIPQYIIWNNLSMINTYVPLIVPKFLAMDGFFTFLFYQFIRGLPRDLDEAAKIDGAGHVRIFFQVLLPLMKPAIGTTAVFTFMWTWNDFFSQLIYLTDPAKYTVPIALRTFIDATSQSSYGPMFAMSVLSMVPLRILPNLGLLACDLAVLAVGVLLLPYTFFVLPVFGLSLMGVAGAVAARSGLAAYVIR